MKKSCTEVQHRSDRVILALKIARPVTFLCEREGHGKPPETSLAARKTAQNDSADALQTTPSRADKILDARKERPHVHERRRTAAGTTRRVGTAVRVDTHGTRTSAAQPPRGVGHAVQKTRRTERPDTPRHETRRSHGRKRPQRPVERRRIKMDTRWVLSWCDKNGTWHAEAWRYGDHACAMGYAQDLMDWQNAQAAIVEQVSTEHPCAYLPETMKKENRYFANGLWCTRKDPWNWKQEDWQRGVRVRERARKKHRQE